MDATDHTVPRHAFPKLPYAELEIAQSLLARASDIEAIATIVSAALIAAL
jgi:hypothetical protein